MSAYRLQPHHFSLSPLPPSVGGHCLPPSSSPPPRWMVVNHGFPIKEINNDGPVQFFLYGVTIVVVAVPEGLPLAVTISLAYR